MVDPLKEAVAVILLTVAIAATMPACEGATHVTTASVSSSPRQTIAPTNPAVATVPFDLNGIGDRDTSFRSAIPWIMTWRFDCAALGQVGHFTLAVTDDNGRDRATSGGSGMQGHGTVINSDADKTFGLEIRSTCHWQISASS